MTDWYFIACKRFTPSNNDSWEGYRDFSGFGHIVELVTMDEILCPNLVCELIDDDWEYNIHADNRTHWFVDYEYLKHRINYDSKRHNILAIREQPSDTATPPQGFKQCGFDIVDSYESISVLTNCGQFPGFFDPTEVNSYGLLDALERAFDVADNIRKENTDEPHCQDCRVWQIAQHLE